MKRFSQILQWHQAANYKDALYKSIKYNSNTQ